MIITGWKLYCLSAPLRTPFRTALRSVDSIRDVVLVLETDTGEKGYGEAPPTGVITGDTFGGIVSAINDHIGPAILGMEVDCPEPVLKKIQASMVHATSAKAAADMAVYDLYGKLLKVPLAKLLGGARRSVETDITISVNDPDTMARDALLAKERGYDVLKVKVGIDPSLDTLRLQRIREAVGDDLKLRIDANQAWTPKEAVRILSRMQEKGLGIELCEQPVKGADLEGLAYVTAHSDVPILADESVFGPMDAWRILERRAADMINIKLMKCGGLLPAMQIASMAEAAGVECMIGCMLEAKISVSAAAALACARSVFTKIDLDGPVLCSYDPVRGGAVFDEKKITANETPGLGIESIDAANLTPLSV